MTDWLDREISDFDEIYDRVGMYYEDQDNRIRIALKIHEVSAMKDKLDEIVVVLKSISNK